MTTFIRLFDSNLGRLRVTAFVEGVSLLVLVFVGMPLRYMADIDAVSQAVGPVHGVLFLLYVVQVIQVGVEYRWSIVRILLMLAASFFPFGTFVADARILAPLYRTTTS